MIGRRDVQRAMAESAGPRQQPVADLALGILHVVSRAFDAAQWVAGGMLRGLLRPAARALGLAAVTGLYVAVIGVPAAADRMSRWLRRRVSASLEG